MRGSEVAPHQGESVLLQVEDLQTQFPTARGIVKAVDGVSFTLNRGEIVGVVGESGSGKTMTARSLLRIVPEPGKITNGCIMLDGLELREREMSRVRGRQIAMIFQEPSATLNPVLTVGEQIAEVVRIHHSQSRRSARMQAIEHLREVGIPEPEARYGAYPHELSGGMQQRCMIAIALACNPQLLIADEPTTALDVTIQAQILDLLVKLTTEKKVGLLLITHDIAAAAQVTQRIIVMYAGKIVEEGTTAQIIDDPQHPYTQALLQAMPSMSATRGAKLFEIKGQVPDLANVPSGCPFHPRCPSAIDTCAVQIPTLQARKANHRVSCWLYE
ncbi:ABC transporter ATP-binding protein [Chloroflexi bacterium TSY]|nr:ABC transporter ATP-binding protein [Chloroflexi bacterium TSY]